MLNGPDHWWSIIKHMYSLVELLIQLNVVFLGSKGPIQNMQKPIWLFQFTLMDFGLSLDTICNFM